MVLYEEKYTFIAAVLEAHNLDPVRVVISKIIIQTRETDALKVCPRESDQLQLMGLHFLHSRSYFHEVYYRHAGALVKISQKKT